MNNWMVARFSAAGAAALALLVPVVAGALAPNYSHTAQYISELGALEMPLGGVVSFLGFLPTGLLVGVCLVAAAPAEAAGFVRIGYWLLMCVALAYVGSAFARCDPGCPAEGSVRQQVHNLLGAAEYIGGGIGLILASWGAMKTTPRAGRGVLTLAGVVTLLAFASMASPNLAEWRGLAQRVGETALFGSLLLIGWWPTRAQSGQHMRKDRQW